MVFLAAAIEVDAYFSRYAFSLKHEFVLDPSKIHIKKWESCEGMKEKIPTSLLLTSQQTLAGLGYDAERMYLSLADKSHLKGSYYFQHFGKILYDRCALKNRTKLKDTEGRKMPALTIFSIFIKSLMNDLLEEIKVRLGDLIPTSFIFWVLTFPASGGDEARQFMREAAVNAGIDDKQILFVPKPVAVLNFYKCLLDTEDGAENKENEDLPNARKYLILDAGDDRTDATFIEMLPSNRVRVLSMESITEGKSSLVDKAILRCLVKLVGHRVMDRFSNECPKDYFDLLGKIRRIKTYFMGEKSGNITIKFPLSLQERFEKESEKRFKDAIKQSMYHDKISCLFDKLRISNDLIKSMFEPPISAIVNSLTVLFGNPKIQGTDTILLAGGFSESPVLQMAVRTAFSTKKVLLSEDVGDVALKGTVLYGLRADIVEVDTESYWNDAAIDNESHMEHDNVSLDNAQGGGIQIVNQEKIEEFNMSNDSQAQTVGTDTTGQNHHSLELNESFKEIQTSLEDLKEDVKSIKETVETLKHARHSFDEISIKLHKDGTLGGEYVTPNIRKPDQGNGEADTGPLATRQGCGDETGVFMIYFHALCDVISASTFRRFFRTLVYLSAQENGYDVPAVDVWIDKREHDYKQSSEAHYQLLREWLRWYGQLDVKLYMNLVTKAMQECHLNEENEKYMERIKSRQKKRR